MTGLSRRTRLAAVGRIQWRGVNPRFKLSIVPDAPYSLIRSVKTRNVNKA
jgi:hypothetical protein